LREFKQALITKPDIIMLDNMKIRDIRKAVNMGRTKDEGRRTPLLEASGGINLEKHQGSRRNRRGYDFGWRFDALHKGC